MLNHGFNRVDRWPTSALGDRPNLSRTPAQELRAPPTLAVAKIGINDIADSDVFNLSSNPLASKTIYLDFDGIDLSETAWNSASEVGTTNRLASLAAFTFDADASFSSSELNAIKEIWMRVAADYAPFEINITTRMPDADAIFRSSESDNQYGTTVAIGLVGSQWSGAGGVAWLGAFSDLNSNFFKPALVFSNRLSNSAKAIAEAASHEAGHNLNLKHDGRIMPSEEYYKGGGRSPGWAPIMGNSYASILTQFSRGDYASASNSENDFTLIQDQGVARYGDADNNSFEQASMIDLDSSGYGSLVDSIAINSYDGLEAPDFDYFKFISPVNGIVDLKVNNALIYADPLDTAMFKASDLPAGFGNLHLDAQIYGNSGEVLADWNNNNALDVSQLSYSGLVSGETYLIRIQANSNLPDQTYGESSWGSVGSYVLRLQTTSFPTIAIEAIDADASETAVGVAADPAVFRLTRSGNTDKALSVTVAYGGSATRGLDYPALPTSVSFAAGSATALVSIPIVDDANYEGEESLVLSLMPGLAYLLDPVSSAIARIRDNDLPIISVVASDASAAETVASIAPNPGRFTFTRSGNNASELSVNLAITGTAQAGVDYGSLPATISFAAGLSTAVLNLEVIDDQVYEATESVTLSIVADPAYKLGTQASATVSLADNDLPTIAIEAIDAVASETAVGVAADPALFRLTRSGNTDKALSVTVAYGGSATRGLDYPALPTSVSFAAGSDFAILKLDAIDDRLIEPMDNVVVTLKSASSYKIDAAAASASATIVDNDLRPTLSISTALSGVYEDSGSGIVFTVQSDLARLSPWSATYSVAGTATAQSDYTGISTTRTVTFAANQFKSTISVRPTADTVNEIDESVAISLNESSGYLVDAASSQAIVSILNDDISSNTDYTLQVMERNLLLTGFDAIDAQGNGFANSITGNVAPNRISGAAAGDILTGGLGADVFVLPLLTDSLLSGMDRITDFRPDQGDWLKAPDGYLPQTLTSADATLTSLSAASIASTFINLAAGQCAAFRVTGQNHTYVLINDATAGFAPASDAIIRLDNFSIGSTAAWMVPIL